ncbi:putative salicylate hydroxylase [Aspergillus steynii IBT 23096]|uniref:Putative salicylate hydroxylase n=1 Tax=Aspergillus steynii IBT 23096 TaxID=1392250 RepID=A0A2I2G3H5_9EURO|nr:putative salicylate hydroxylase [Aspergillus steynii IBT 23096]PLB47432.1 putative salicylate hydroxylase [Aspergillus steynii IBT 23096]
MKVIIVGAGLGGLVCAIACRRENIEVVVLERSVEISPVGAGIQIPPNGSRIMKELGLLPRVLEKGAIIESMDIRRYKDGSVITSMPCGETVTREYGAPWIMIHRADYQMIILDKARSLGVDLRLNAAVEDVILESPHVVLAGGEKLFSDVVIGADGLWSSVRSAILSRPCLPIDTGDLAYRATFSRAQLEALVDPQINELCAKTAVTAWFGPKNHAVFYPIRGATEFNLVLLQPDDLPAGVRTQQGDLDEVRYGYRDWDETLQRLISCVPSILKWKLCHLPELSIWSKGHTTLLGDACHPTLPYQAQGAAMAVEDGAVLGMLLGAVASRRGSLTAGTRTPDIPDVLKLYEEIRKPYTSRNVNGAVRNRSIFHLEDGIVQWLRDKVMGLSGLTRETDWSYIMSYRYRQMLGTDVLREAERGLQKLLGEINLHSHED